MVHPSDRDRAEAPVYTTSDVRQGHIVLRTPTRRRIFFGGLVGLAVLVLVLALLG